jgi:23S rRNA (guanine745-N1)-methyltransferase
VSIKPFQALACPLDGTPLHRNGSAWRCASGHSFDIASQGYTNLLPVQNKRSRDPGDSKEMVAARRRFLTAGLYQPIAAAVSRAVLADLPTGESPTNPTSVIASEARQSRMSALAMPSGSPRRFAPRDDGVNRHFPDATSSCLDAGCGEGYYLRQLAAAAPDEQTLAVLGLDISKWAVLSAAKQDRRPNWIVGSNANLPVLSGTLDRVLCLFGFPVYAEFARVLKPGGRLVQVDAGPDHLRELREIIYPSLKPERTAEMPAPEGFSRLPTETLRFSIELTSAGQIADLLAMTPHLYRANAEGRAEAAALTALSLGVDVRLTCFERDRG